MNKKDVLALIEPFKDEACFAGFKLRKSDCYFIRKFDWGWQKVRFTHHNGFDLDRKELALEIKVGYSIRFNCLHDFVQPYSPYNLKEYSSIAFSEGMIRRIEKNEYTWGDNAQEFEYFFLESRKDAEKDYRIFKDGVLKHAACVFNNYCTMTAIYNFYVVPILEGKTKLWPWEGAAVFKYLLLARIVKPNEYPNIKKKLFEIQDYWRTKDNWANNGYSSYEPYYLRRDEVCEVLESLPIDLPKELIG